jgi:hypothetical protein
MLKIILCKKEGVKGMLPSGYLPHWGERGGHPHSCCRELPNDGKKRVSIEPIIPQMDKFHVLG